MIGKALNAKQSMVVLSGIALTLMLVVIIGRSFYTLSGERKRDERLSAKLINEFHERYNSGGQNGSSELLDLYGQDMQSARAWLGDFLQIRDCETERMAEPPWVAANCVAVFEKLEVKERFIITHSADDSHVLVYTLTSEKGSFSIP